MRIGSENGRVCEDLLPSVLCVQARDYDGDIRQVGGVVKTIVVSDIALIGVLRSLIRATEMTGEMSWRPWSL